MRKSIIKWLMINFAFCSPFGLAISPEKFAEFQKKKIQKLEEDVDTLTYELEQKISGSMDERPFLPLAIPSIVVGSLFTWIPVIEFFENASGFDPSKNECEHLNAQGAFFFVTVIGSLFIYSQIYSVFFCTYRTHEESVNFLKEKGFIADFQDKIDYLQKEEGYYEQESSDQCVQLKEKIATFNNELKKINDTCDRLVLKEMEQTKVQEEDPHLVKKIGSVLFGTIAIANLYNVLGRCACQKKLP